MNRRTSFDIERPISRGESKTPEKLEEAEQKEAEEEVKRKRFSFGLTPRKSLDGSMRQGVRFEDFRPVFR